LTSAWRISVGENVHHICGGSSTVIGAARRPHAGLVHEIRDERHQVAPAEIRHAASRLKQVPDARKQLVHPRHTALDITQSPFPLGRID
jgi:hypothetical protein